MEQGGHLPISNTEIRAGPSVGIAIRVSKSILPTGACKQTEANVPDTPVHVTPSLCMQ